MVLELLIALLIALSTYSLFVASPFSVAFATLLTFIPPALIPSLLIVTVFVSPAAPSAPAAVLAIDTPSAPKVILLPGLLSASAFVIDVIFFKSLANFTFNVVASVPSFFTEILF